MDPDRCLALNQLYLTVLNSKVTRVRVLEYSKRCTAIEIDPCAQTILLHLTPISATFTVTTQTRSCIVPSTDSSGTCDRLQTAGEDSDSNSIDLMHEQNLSLLGRFQDPRNSTERTNSTPSATSISEVFMAHYSAQFNHLGQVETTREAHT